MKFDYSIVPPLESPFKRFSKIVAQALAFQFMAGASYMAGAEPRDPRVTLPSEGPDWQFL
jgi:hypothetical protein